MRLDSLIVGSDGGVLALHSAAFSTMLSSLYDMGGFIPWLMFASKGGCNLHIGVA
jgi:hypothetical protein